MPLGYRSLRIYLIQQLFSAWSTKAAKKCKWAFKLKTFSDYTYSVYSSKDCICKMHWNISLGFSTYFTALYTWHFFCVRINLAVLWNVDLPRTNIIWHWKSHNQSLILLIKNCKISKWNLFTQARMIFKCPLKSLLFFYKLLRPVAA